MKAKAAILTNLKGEATSYTPIWVMRQAGRYLPEYRKLRAKIGNFKEMYLNPETASEVTLMPLARFPLDAAIVFSDILIVLDAIGIDVSFKEGIGPIIEKPIRSRDDLAKLSTSTDLVSYEFLAKTLKICKDEIKDQQALIGFVGSPWTLATYAVEGGSSKNFSKVRSLVYNRPDIIMPLLERLTDEIKQLILLQIESGADVIQIFDSWAGLLDRDYYLKFSYKYISEIVDFIRAKSPATPMIVFAKSSPLTVQEMASCRPACVSIDWQTNIQDAFVQVSNLNKTDDSDKNSESRKIAIQGNLDPAALYGDEKTIDSKLDAIMKARPAGAPHIFNLGHGIYPDVDPDKLAYLVDRVHRYERV